ncbi:hypothetical protein KKH65_04360, partial [bacterium]|nr:hypothetical protein [bacterium]
MDSGSIKQKLGLLVAGVVLSVGIFMPKGAESMTLSTMTPNRGTVSISVILTGSMSSTWNYGDKVWIDFGTSQTLVTATSDSGSGAFTINFNVNTQSYGTQYITVYHINEGPGDQENIVTTTFFILPNIYYSQPVSGPVGTLITIKGSGFTKDSSVALEFGTSLDTDLNASIDSGNQFGTFSANFRVNTQFAGTKVITAIDASGRKATTIFIINPFIHCLDPPSATVGITVTIQGNGYGSGSLVGIGFGTNQTITTTIASTSGTFSTTFTVDTQPGGSQVITAKDADGNLQTTVFWIKCKIYLVAPGSGYVEDTITIEASGFMSTELVRIDFGTHQTITTVQMTGINNSNGTFSTTFAISTQKYGNKDITVLGQILGNTDVYINAVKILSRITVVNPSTTTVGSSVTVEGTGFDYTGVDNVNVYLGAPTSETFLGDAVLYNSGTFSEVFTINTKPYGTKVITAKSEGGASPDAWATSTLFITP